jgi:tetratricopeptide (TPR) repeat protein
VLAFEFRSRPGKNGSSGGARVRTSDRLARWLLGASALLWGALYVNNLASLGRNVGFDVDEHWKYIDYLLRHRTLPLAHEGWEMFQPPLYYAVAAAVLALLGLSPDDFLATAVLRLLSLGFALAHCLLVYACLRLALPTRPRAQVLGLLLAAVLPVHLYLAHYVTNEVMAATLATASVYLCLRLLERPDEKGSDPLKQGVRPLSFRTLLQHPGGSPWGYAAFGVCLGATLLTKATALLLAPVLLAALGGRLLSQGREWRVWLRTVGVSVLACAAVSGWYYGRVWWHFGTPVVGNWDRAAGFSWWQEPGYQTAASYLRFGRALKVPLFSGLAGVPDGLYSTLWGDGLCSGVVDLRVRPPWNYDLMTAGYLLALVPSLAVGVGAVLALVELVRRPRAELFLVTGTAFALGMGVVFMTLKVPSFAQAKAGYGLSGLLPLCLFGAWGLDVALGCRRALRVGACTLLGTWALCSYASFWIRPAAPQTPLYRGVMLATAGYLPEAVQEFRDAAQLDPQNAEAPYRIGLALALMKRKDEAVLQYQTALRLDSGHAPCLLALAEVLLEGGDDDAAVNHARQALALAPDLANAHKLLASVSLRQGHPDAAVREFREELRIDPDNHQVHHSLGVALVARGDTEEALTHFAFQNPDPSQAHTRLARELLGRGKLEEALMHYQEAYRASPDSLPAMAGLAWVLATHPDPSRRDGREAVRLAETTCERTGFQDGTALDALAAAYAEVGRFSEAVRWGQRSLEAAGRAGRSAQLPELRARLELYKQGRAYRLTVPPGSLKPSPH